ncbi:MAG: hypothetical protein LBJ95_04370 [Oscillospiraceae bacterium]|jgi:hypothetical protein|nr:hypothetical protein [Oscillospiraceae bacterium]
MKLWKKPLLSTTLSLILSSIVTCQSALAIKTTFNEDLTKNNGESRSYTYIAYYNFDVSAYPHYARYRVTLDTIDLKYSANITYTADKLVTDYHTNSDVKDDPPLSDDELKLHITRFLPNADSQFITFAYAFSPASELTQCNDLIIGETQISFKLTHTFDITQLPDYAILWSSELKCVHQSHHLQPRFDLQPAGQETKIRIFPTNLAYTPDYQSCDVTLQTPDPGTYTLFVYFHPEENPELLYYTPVEIPLEILTPNDPAAPVYQEPNDTQGQDVTVEDPPAADTVDTDTADDTSIPYPAHIIATPVLTGSYVITNKHDRTILTLVVLPLDPDCEISFFATAFNTECGQVTLIAQIFTEWSTRNAARLKNPLGDYAIPRSVKFQYGARIRQIGLSNFTDFVLKEV